MKMKKNKLTNLFKTGILLFGISLFLWNCENESNSEDITLQQSAFSIPTIEKSKSNFENTNNGNHIFLEYSHSKNKPSSLKSKSSFKLELSADWESSSIKTFHENLNILYTPVKTNTTNRIKTILASVNNAGEIETFSLTLFYDDDSNENHFSGIILKYAIAGHFVEAYKYTNGIKTETYLPEETSKAKGYAAKSGGCNYTLADAISNFMHGFSSGIALDGFCLGSGGGGGHTPFDISQNNWSNPNNYLTHNVNFNNDYSGGGGLNTGNNNNSAGGDRFGNAAIEWWMEEVQIFNELTAPCAKGIFKILEKESPLGPTVDASIVQSFTLSGEILNMFKHSDKFNYTIKNGSYLNNANTSSSGNIITITISDEYLSKATKLSIARTMIHESVHAYILHNIKPRVNTEFRNDIQVYADKYPGTNRYHHEFMGEYVKAMAVSLYNWDKNNGGGNLGWDYYEAMAYGGLFYAKKDSNGNILKDSNGDVIIEETDSFKKLEPIKFQRDRIKQILYNEQEGNKNAKGTKCN
jgi:hypothetical protein